MLLREAASAEICGLVKANSLANMRPIQDSYC
jgi:hypothetical protein